jgi:hypothetical protein
MAENLIVVQRFIINPSRTHPDVSHSVGLLSTNDQSDPQRSTSQHNTTKHTLTRPLWNSDPKSQQANTVICLSVCVCVTGTGINP